MPTQVKKGKLSEYRASTIFLANVYLILTLERLLTLADKGTLYTLARDCRTQFSCKFSSQYFFTLWFQLGALCTSVNNYLSEMPISKKIHIQYI